MSPMDDERRVTGKVTVSPSAFTFAGGPPAQARIIAAHAVSIAVVKTRRFRMRLVRQRPSVAETTSSPAAAVGEP